MNANDQQPKPWFVFGRVPENPSDPQEIMLYGEIGAWGVNASDFIAEAKKVPAAQPLRVRINSTGGNIFDALAMFNWLRARGNVETVIDGLAASSGSLVAMAGSKRTMPKCSYLMVHKPWAGAVGNGDQLREQADLLDKFADMFANAYAMATGIAKAAVMKAMEAESWIVGTDAKKEGWITDLIDAEPAKASIAQGRYGKTPAQFLASISAPPTEPNSPADSTANNNTSTSTTMQKLLAALAQAGVISSPTLGEDAAVAEFNANITALNKQVTEAKASLAAQAKANATTLVEAAVADGRIKADVKDQWVASIVANADAAKLLAAIEKPKVVMGAVPVGPSSPNVPDNAKPKNLTEQCIEARAKLTAK